MPIVYSVKGALRPYSTQTSGAEASIERSQASSSVDSNEFEAILEAGTFEAPAHKDKPEKKAKRFQRQIPKRKPRHLVLLAKDVMSTPVITLLKSSSIQDAKKIMKTHRFRHLPIVDEKNQVVGMVSERDLLHTDALGVEAVMSRKVLSATPSTALHEVAEVLLLEKISALPVVEEIKGNTRLVGILTTSDLLRSLMEQAPIELWA